MALQMKNPAHPGELVRDILDELEVTIVDAAKAIGVTRQQLHNVIAGRSAVTSEMAIRLEKSIGSTAETWLRMQMNYDLAHRKQVKSALSWSALKGYQLPLRSSTAMLCAASLLMRSQLTRQRVVGTRSSATTTS